MPRSLFAACAAALALLVVGADEAAEECPSGGACALEGDELSLMQGRNLLSKRSSPPYPSGKFNSRSCISAGGGSWQCYPDIMIVGASKAGTTSLSSSLKQHPAIDLQAAPMPALSIGDKDLREEAHIFDYHLLPEKLMKAMHWATSPTIPDYRVANSQLLQYTPNYMYYPDTPYHIKNVYPNADNIKYIFMVRDPAKRAVSAWKFHRQLTLDLRPFGMVVRNGMRQRRRLEACYRSSLRRLNKTAKVIEDLPTISQQKKVTMNCFWRPFTHDITTPPESPVTLMHAHVDKGIYVDQLRRWFSIVGRQNCFVFSLEEWARNETDVFLQVLNFTGLQAVGPGGFKDMATLNRTVNTRYNEVGGMKLGGMKLLIKEPPQPRQALLDQLERFYKPYNEALFKLVGRKLF